MKIIRDYLKSDELNFIVNAMLEKDNALDREIVKVGLVAQLLGEDIGEFNDCNEVYDKVVADSTINLSAIVNNYDIIDKLVAEELGVNNILKGFVDSINERLDKMGDIDLNGAIKQLKEIADKEGGELTDGNNNEILKPSKKRKSVS